MRRLVGIVAMGLLVTSCFVVRPPTPNAGPTPPDAIVLEVVATGLDRPWDVAFTTGGFAFVTERSGNISFLIDSHRRVLHRPPDVRVSGEGGMLGLALHPDFHAGKPFLYACFTSSLGSTPPGEEADVRVVRWRVDAAVSALSDRSDVVTGMPYSTGRHSGCRPRFGPDGNLWIATGDGVHGSTPQDLESRGGKVLRVDENGDPAPGNPDLSVLDPDALDDVYTYGHRNVQGLGFHPGSGTPYSVEHGPGRDDEVNRLVAGMNAGWDPGPGYDETVPMTDFSLPGAVGAVWSSGTPTIAPSGADFIGHGKWGSWQGALATAVLKGRHLRIFFLDGAGEVTAWTTLLSELDTRIRSVVAHPNNGDLYLTTDVGGGGGNVWRLTPL